MSDLELLLAIAGIMVAITAGVVIPVALKFATWMGVVTTTLADIRVHQGRHDERLDIHDGRLDKHEDRLERHEDRLDRHEST